MINQMKRAGSFLTAAFVALSLCACGSGGDQELTGDDWRVSGVVAGSGTITHTGEGSVDVLVTISSESAAFYRDSSEQVLFDSVLFPMEIPDAEQSFNAISFDDINGDGESDVVVNFIDENDVVTELVWLWDPDERYIYREDLSILPSDPEEDAEVTTGETSDFIGDYVGLWEYQGENLWLRIEDNAEWAFVNDQDDTLDSGTLWADENGVTLHFEDTGDVLQLNRDENGNLIDVVNDGLLMPTEAIQEADRTASETASETFEETTPYFSENGLSINALIDNGTYLLKNGVSSYSGLGDGYNVDDCYWEIIKKGDYTHDGIREIEFDAVCYVPMSSIPAFSQQYVTNTDSELYDFYTGVWLTAATSYGDSSRGENYYLHTLESGEQIEFSYSTEWKNNVGDWASVLTKSYIVYFPEDYDGLVFAAETEPEAYRDCAKRMQLDSISPEAKIMDIDLVDPYSCLYFSLCY